MQILLFEKVAFDIVAGIYHTLAYTYSLLIDLARIMANEGGLNISGVTTTMYVLASVFMLFRVTISMIQILINPDLTSDGQASPGKILTRILTSLVLLILFIPNGIFFGDNGILNRLELAILEPETGLIDRLTSSSKVQIEKTNSRSDIYNNPKDVRGNSNILHNSYFVENVSAKSPLTCYYYDVKATENNSASNARNDIKIYDFYKVTFSTTETSGFKELKGLNVKTGNVYYSFSNELVHPDDETSNRFIVPSKDLIIDSSKAVELGFAIKDGIWAWSDSRAAVPDDCPKYISNYEQDANMSIGRTANSDGDHMLIGGQEDINKMIEEMNLEYEDDDVEAPTGNSDVEEHAKTSSLFCDDYTNNGNSRISDEAFSFSQNIAKTFQQCADGSLNEINDNNVEVYNMDEKELLEYCKTIKNPEKNCACVQTQMFRCPQGQTNFSNLYAQEGVSLDFITSIVAGIAILVFVGFLCVEVIIRRFKLLLLEIMAPIPIVSYIDPKDKMLNQWSKMYIATYLDLFIKLIAINLATLLLANVSKVAPKGHLLLTFAYIIAILMFAKMVPSLISKITGLDDLGGSFGKIGGMAKAGLGMTAGTVIGGSVGFATGIHAAKQAWGNKEMSGGNKALAVLGGLGSSITGGVKGAGSGLKGNVLGGAKSAAAANAYRGSQYRSGLSPTDIMLARTLGKIGMDEASIQDRKMQADSEKLEELNKIAGIKGEMENIAEESKFMQTLRRAAARGDHHLTEDQIQNLRASWIQANLSGSKDDASALNAMMDDYGWSYSDKIIEAGKQNGLREKLTTAQTLISQNDTVSQTLNQGHGKVLDKDKKPITVTTINTFDDVDNASKIAKNYQTDIRNEQTRIKESPGYRTAKAATQSENSNPNK